MKVAISATGRDLDAEADPRFGRCRYFIIADPQTMEFEALDNSDAMAAGGAGVSAAQAIADKNVQALLTGNCGPNAYQVLAAAGIQLITGVSGRVKDVIENYRLGKYQVSRQSNVPDHFGMGGMRGVEGRGGMWGGRGKGRGMGKGIGTGRGMGMGMKSNMPSSPEAATLQQSAEEELLELKMQSQTLARQLSDIQRRIEKLETK